MRGVFPVHVIDTGDHPPVKQPIRRIPFVHREKISTMVDEMLAQGVIQPSVSAWSSPVVLVPKKDGTSRFCVDYRRLNGVSRKDVYPLPRIDDIFDTLGDTKYFSSLDLCSGYWQIELEPESRPKSAFVTHRGLHKFIRLPFGLCNGPSTFQRLMEQQYDRKSMEIRWKVGDRVMVHMPGTIKGKAWKFARAFYGPYRILTITPTNAEVRLVDKPEERPIFVALD
jgi:hypothetical protein